MKFLGFSQLSAVLKNCTGETGTSCLTTVA